MNRIFALVGVLLAAFAIFYLATATPPPRSADAPATTFSAKRAMVDIAVMAKVPHPVGSPANGDVRDYLLDRMTALGLSPRVARSESLRVRAIQDAVYAGDADVENVVGVLAGSDRSRPALALMAHYDSVPGSPGAADDITGVADVLEIVRAIKAQGVPARDVVVAITDGEEAGLLGAQAFFDADALASHVGFVINLESRGGGGRAAMFETGADNGAVIDLFARTAKSPDANALTAYVYKLLPNDTDFSVARARNIPGLNYAFIGRQFDYHSPSSTVAALDQGSVQQMGDQALGTARALAFSPTLPKRAPDAVYSDVFGLSVIAYPTWGGWIVLAAALGLMAIGHARLAAEERPSWIDVLQGSGAALLVLLAAALLLLLTRHATGVGSGWFAYRPLLARFAPFEVAMALSGLAGLLIIGAAVQTGRGRWPIAIGALALGVLTFFVGDFDVAALVVGGAVAALAGLLVARRARTTGTWAGVILTGLAAALAVQIVAPTAAFLIAWPLIAACACAALTGWGTRRAPITLVPAVGIATLALAWLGGFFHALLQGLDMPAGPAIIVALGAMLLWPLTQPATSESKYGCTTSLVPLASGLVIAVWLNLTSPWTARRPAAAEPLYIVDADGKAWRAAPLPLAPWTKHLLIADGGVYGERDFPGLPGKFGAVPGSGQIAAPLIATTAPILVSHDSDGTVTLRAGPSFAAQNLDLRVGEPVSDVRINGKPAAILTRPGAWTHLRRQAAREDLILTFRSSGTGDITVNSATITDGPPAGTGPLPAMPPNVMAWDRAGSTVLLRTWVAKW